MRWSALVGTRGELECDGGSWVTGDYGVTGDSSDARDSSGAGDSVTEAFGSPVTKVAPMSATEGSGSKFSCVEVSNRSLRAENQTLLAGYGVHSALRHQGAAQNTFSPLLGLGSEENFCFGERNASMMVSGEKGERWSHLDGVEMLQVGPEQPLL